MSDPYRTPAAQEPQSPPPPWSGGRWEYNHQISAVSSFLELDQLDSRGANGWELVSIVPVGLRQLLYVYKRPTHPEPGAVVPR